MTKTWNKNDEYVVVTGKSNPRSPVGSSYLLLGDMILITTWRGKEEWRSKWKELPDEIIFESIDTPEGVVIDWGSKKILKRFIPSRHLEIIKQIAEQKKLRLLNWEASD